MNDEMTQQQLAEQVDVTRQTIVAIENGKYSPTLELAFKIAAVFKKNWVKYSLMNLKNKLLN